MNTAIALSVAARRALAHDVQTVIRVAGDVAGLVGVRSGGNDPSQLTGAPPVCYLDRFLMEVVMLNKSKSVVMGLLAAGATVGAMTIPATAYATVDAAAPQAFKNVATGRCLDSGTDQEVHTNGCNGGNYQNWIVTNSGSGVTLKNVATGRCLDSGTDQEVHTNGCNGGNYQNWARTGNGGPLRNIATGRCLDSGTDQQVHTNGCNGGNYQNWAS